MPSNITAKPKFLFLTQYVVKDTFDSKGPIGERYAGLYYAFMQKYATEFDFFWFSGAEGELFRYSRTTATLETIAVVSSTFQFHKMLSRFIRTSYSEHSFFLVSYPYFQHHLVLATMLFMLRNHRAHVVLDIQDMPKLANMSINRKRYWYWTLVEKLYSFYTSYILNAQESIPFYARTKSRTFVIPMASHHEVVTPPPLKEERSGLTVVYLGTILASRGILDLIDTIRCLRKEGFDIHLRIIGDNADRLPLEKDDWVFYHEPAGPIEFVKLLWNSDVGIIPYTDFAYCNYLSMSKTAAYMAAGLPIISMELTETSRILHEWKCGISVKTWSEMASAIKRLYSDTWYRSLLSQNARKAAVQEYNWTRQVDRLASFIKDLSDPNF